MDSIGIEVFLQIVRNRSISKAAMEMHLTQSTISKRLQMLEDSLGYVLIERGKGLKTLNLTYQGQEFVHIAERWQDLSTEAHQIGKTKPHYKLNIGTVPSANMTFVPQLCKRLWNHTPDIHTRVISLHSREMYDEIERRNIDIGFSLVEQVHPNVIVKPCFSVPMIGICLKQKTRKALTNVRILDAENCIFIPWGTRYQTWFDYWFHSSEMPKMSIDNPYMLFTVLEHPEQWAIVPQAIANLLTESGKFSTFRLSQQPPNRLFFKLTHKYPKPHVLPAIDAFNQYLNEELKTSYTNVYQDIHLEPHHD